MQLTAARAAREIVAFISAVADPKRWRRRLGEGCTPMPVGSGA